MAVPRSTSMLSRLSLRAVSKIKYLKRAKLNCPKRVLNKYRRLSLPWRLVFMTDMKVTILSFSEYEKHMECTY